MPPPPSGGHLAVAAPRPSPGTALGGGPATRRRSHSGRSRPPASAAGGQPARTCVPSTPAPFPLGIGRPRPDDPRRMVNRLGAGCPRLQLGELDSDDLPAEAGAALDPHGEPEADRGVAEGAVRAPVHAAEGAAVKAQSIGAVAQAAPQRLHWSCPGLTDTSGLAWSGGRV